LQVRAASAKLSAGEIFMRIRGTGGALAFASLLASYGSAQAYCSVPRFSFTIGGQSYASMTTDSGAPCNVKLREGNGTIIKSIVALSPPRQGTIRQVNSVNFAYQARRGFKGEETVTIGISGTKHGVPGTARVTMRIWVVGEGPPGQQAVAAVSAAPTRSAQPTRRTSAPVAQHTPQRKQQQAAAPTGLRAKCLQQVGAGLDPVTKRWAFFVSEGDAMSRIDMLKMCLAEGDRAKANRIAVPEIWMTHPGDRGPRQR
jgi:hypothetical protein